MPVPYQIRKDLAQTLAERTRESELQGSTANELAAALETNMRQTNRDVLTAIPANVLGGPKDLAQLMLDVRFGASYPPMKAPQIPLPGSADIQQSLGGDPNSQASLIASLLSPDATDVAKVAKIIGLTHFSRADNLTEIDPKFYGQGIRGAELKRKQANPELWVDRSYFYAGDNFRKEPGLGPVQYSAEIDDTGLYDLAADPDGFFKQLPDEWDSNKRVTAAEKMAKEAGYDGYFIDAGHGKIVATFNKTKVTKK